MPVEPANLNPPVTPAGQALTMKEFQVFRPVRVPLAMRTDQSTHSLSNPNTDTVTHHALLQYFYYQQSIPGH